MCIASATRWRFILVLALAFVVWVLLLEPILPVYARVVVPVAQGVLQGLEPHGATISFIESFPKVEWQVGLPTQRADESISFRLLTFNLALYLALVTALAGLRWKQWGLLLATGLPVLFGFHVVDLLVVVESRLLSLLQPQNFIFWRDFDLWFVALKFYSSFSAMALRQIFPFAVVFLQWHALRKLGPQSRWFSSIGM